MAAERKHNSEICTLRGKKTFLLRRFSCDFSIPLYRRKNHRKIVNGNHHNQHPRNFIQLFLHSNAVKSRRRTLLLLRIHSTFGKSSETGKSVGSECEHEFLVYSLSEALSIEVRFKLWVAFEVEVYSNSLYVHLIIVAQKLSTMKFFRVNCALKNKL